MACGLPSSKTSKSSAARPVTKFPCASFTVTSTSTTLTLTLKVGCWVERERQGRSPPRASNQGDGSWSSLAYFV